MADIELVIKIPEEVKNRLCFGVTYAEDIQTVCEALHNGTPLPKYHGRLIDIGKIDEDKIDKDNPIIGLTINGEYIEAVSLDYLNNLSTIVEADKAEGEEQTHD